jgi:hypothetical protein
MPMITQGDVCIPGGFFPIVLKAIPVSSPFKKDLFRLHLLALDKPAPVNYFRNLTMVG